MRYVIIRDDDTNALTPVECLERLYRPFLDRGLPVNLATIPAVSVNAKMRDGQPEGFLPAECHEAAGLPRDDRSAVVQRSRGAPNNSWSRHCCRGEEDRTVPIGLNRHLVGYLLENPGFKIVQHGCHHDFHEFARKDRKELGDRLGQGTQLLVDAGFTRPQTFVAPYDCISCAGLKEITRRFRVLSTGWFEMRRLPCTWWPRYLLKKLRHEHHWHVNGTLLLSHPGCLLSYHRTLSTMMEGIRRTLKEQQLTVLVTHWWEYFRNGEPDDPFIDFLHETADYLATHPELKVISFSDLIDNSIRVN